MQAFPTATIRRDGPVRISNVALRLRASPPAFPDVPESPGVAMR